MIAVNGLDVYLNRIKGCIGFEIYRYDVVAVLRGKAYGLRTISLVDSD